MQLTDVLFHYLLGWKEVGLGLKWIPYLMNNEKLLNTMFVQGCGEPGIGA